MIFLLDDIEPHSFPLYACVWISSANLKLNNALTIIIILPKTHFISSVFYEKIAPAFPVQLVNHLRVILRISYSSDPLNTMRSCLFHFSRIHLLLSMTVGTTLVQQSSFLISAIETKGPVACSSPVCYLCCCEMMSLSPL